MTTTREHTCSQCGAEFLTNALLDEHVRQAHSPTRDATTCSLCGMHLDSRLLLERHFEETHREPVPDGVPCSECGVVLRDAAELEEHLAQEHPAFTGMTRDTGPSSEPPRIEN